MMTKRKQLHIDLQMGIILLQNLQFKCTRQQGTHVMLICVNHTVSIYRLPMEQPKAVDP